MKWYEKSYRRHLCDMHIDDWDDAFLREFSPEEYFENLKLAQVTSPMIYLQSHVGHCYWPTQVGHMHKAFEGRENMIRQLIDLCHEAGMSVVGYYSPTYNSYEHDRHVEWRMVDKNGHSYREEGIWRYGLLCPNNIEVRKFYYEQIAEIAAYFQVEGMFYDMPFWAYPCYCESCRARWENECGGEIPETENDSRWQLFENKRREWMGEFANDITNVTRRLMPNVTVEWNYAFAALPEDIGTSELVNYACDYVGGDFYQDSVTQVFACLLYGAVSRNQPFEFMISRCDPNLQSHTLTKTEDRLMSMVMRVAAHHGAAFVIDAIDPVGTLDRRVYERIGKVYECFKMYEPYFKGKISKDVGVFYSISSKRNAQGQAFNNYTGSVNSIRSLITAHVPVGIASTETIDCLDEYAFLILSNPNNLPVAIEEKLITYVENGGTLFFSNVDDGCLFNTLIEGRLLGYTESDKTYVAPVEMYGDMFMSYTLKYPLPFSNVRLPMVEDVKGEVLAHITLPYTNPYQREFASIHANPPGISTEYPAMVIRKYKKGTVIWSAAPIENEKHFDYRQIMLNIIAKYGKEYSFDCDASELVEITRYDTDDCIYINVVTLLDNDIASLQEGFEIRVKTKRPIEKVKLLPNGDEIEFNRTEKGISFTTRPLRIFDMYELS